MLSAYILKNISGKYIYNEGRDILQLETILA